MSTYEYAADNPSRYIDRLGLLPSACDGGEPRLVPPQSRCAAWPDCPEGTSPGDFPTPPIPPKPLPWIEPVEPRGEPGYLEPLKDIFRSITPPTGPLPPQPFPGGGIRNQRETTPRPLT